MKQHIFILIFLTSSIQLSLSIKRKFYLYQTPKTWSAAQTFCRSKHIDLATIENAAEVDQLKAEVNKVSYTGWAWIGLYMDLSDYRWSNLNQRLGTTTFWAPGEPGGGTLELCIGVLGNVWSDFPCLRMQPFICFDEGKSGTDRYIYYSTSKTWNQAQSYCWQYHTDLASARDADQMSVISGKITLTYLSTWIGLYKNAHKWSDGTPYTDFTMMAGEPNGASEMCICTFNGQGIDVPCTMQLPFYCYRVITAQRRYIRLKIQSDQDLDKTAVLQTILQKLAEHQITANVTVTWR